MKIVGGVVILVWWYEVYRRPAAVTPNSTSWTLCLWLQNHVLGVILTSYEFFMDILQSEVYFNVVQLLFSQFCVET